MTDILLQIGADFKGADKVNEQLNKLIVLLMIISRL